MALADTFQIDPRNLIGLETELVEQLVGLEVDTRAVEETKESDLEWKLAAGFGAAVVVRIAVVADLALAKGQSSVQRGARKTKEWGKSFSGCLQGYPGAHISLTAVCDLGVIRV